MYSIKLDIDDNIVDKVMLFLNNIPKKSIEVKQIDDNNSHHEKLADFFMQSPLREEIELKRNSQVYKQRVEF
ncbi:MAG: hypothetical protein WCS33_04945 [Candidatus Caldatribacteriota bacterium]|jgi:hypothetical protein